MKLKIIYPSTRFVDENIVRQWFRDAIDNGQIAYDSRIQDIDTENIDWIVEQLEDTGIVTFADKRSWVQ
jgi:hypothetical protein